MRTLITISGKNNIFYLSNDFIINLITTPGRSRRHTAIIFYSPTITMNRRVTLDRRVLATICVFSTIVPSYVQLLATLYSFSAIVPSHVNRPLYSCNDVTSHNNEASQPTNRLGMCHLVTFNQVVAVVM